MKMHDTEFLLALKSILQLDDTIDNGNLLAIIVDLMIRAHGGTVSYDKLREAQEAL